MTDVRSRVEQTDSVELAQPVTDDNQNGAVEPDSRPKQHSANVHPDEDQVLPPEMVACVQALQANLKMPVWLLIQDHIDLQNPYTTLDDEVFEGFWN